MLGNPADFSAKMLPSFGVESPPMPQTETLTLPLPPAARNHAELVEFLAAKTSSVGVQSPFVGSRVAPCIARRADPASFVAWGSAV